jgi:hypothetical protein
VMVYLGVVKALCQTSVLLSSTLCVEGVKKKPAQYIYTQSLNE